MPPDVNKRVILYHYAVNTFPDIIVTMIDLMSALKKDEKNKIIFRIFAGDNKGRKFYYRFYYRQIY